MKYEIAHDLSASYPKYLNSEIESKFEAMKSKVIGKEISPRRDAQLSERFRTTTQSIVALLGLELGFIGDVAQNSNMMHMLSTDIFKAVENTDLTSILSADASEAVAKMYMMHPDASHAIKFIKWIEAMDKENRPRWEMHLRIQVKKLYEVMTENPTEISPHFFVSLLNHPEYDILFSRISEYGNFNILFEKYKDEIAELHEKSNSEDSDIPVEVLASLKGLICLT